MEKKYSHPLRCYRAGQGFKYVSQFQLLFASACGPRCLAMTPANRPAPLLADGYSSAAETAL